MIPEIELAIKYARENFQFRPPEGLVRHGDNAIMYHHKTEYRVRVVFELEEVLM